MTDDQRMAALMTECLAELATATPEGTARARAVLLQIEASAPGEIEAMASRLQLHRLSRVTAH